jgi:putative spermidine/putrescine transport system ATP-binding protein
VLTSSFLGPTSRVTVTVGDVLVVAQVASGLLPSLTAGTPVRVTLQPVPVALED